MPSPWSWQPGTPIKSLESDSEAAHLQTWHRRFWGPELAFAAGTLINPGFADLLISCHLALAPMTSTVLCIQHVRAATRELRWNHPGVAVTLSWPKFNAPSEFDPDHGRFVYQVPRGEHEVIQWLDEIVYDCSDLLIKAGGDLSRAVQLLRQDLGAATAKPSKNMFEVYYIGKPARQLHAIMLHLGHTLFDGIGAFEVLDLWLQELAGVLAPTYNITELPALAWGQEVTRLAKAVPDRVNVPWSPDIRTPTDHYISTKIRSALALPPVEFGLPIFNPNATPTCTGTLLRTLPAPTASLLRSAARAHGCGVFSVLLAANYLSILRLCEPQSSPPGNLFAALIPNAVDLRAKHLAGGSASKLDKSTWQVSSALGANVLVASDLGRFLPTSRDVLADVWTLAQEIQAQVSDQAAYQETAAQWVPDALMLLMDSFFKGPPVPQTRRVVNMSSLGVVDDSLAKFYEIDADGQFEISQPVFTGIGARLPPGSASVVFHPYTWDGTLYFSFSFPEAYMGSLEEQEAAKGEGTVTLLDYVDEYLPLVQRLAESANEKVSEEKPECVVC